MKFKQMRPQDIVVLMKLISTKGRDITNKEIASELGISASEVSEALERCRIARLVDESKKRVNTLALEEFLVHGLKYVFPIIPMRRTRGIVTGISASPIKEKINPTSDVYVWPDTKGDIRGYAITPLYRTVPQAVQSDSKLYELLVIGDTLRIGRPREVEIAKQDLNSIIQEYNAR